MTIFQSKRVNDFLNKALQIAVLIYQGIAVLAFIAIPLLAFKWLNTPFLGAFVEQTMVFNGVGANRDDEAWTLFNSDVQLHDQLLQVDGKDVHSAADIQRALESHFPGEDVPVTYRTPDGNEETVIVTLNEFPAADRVTYFYIPFIVGLAYLATSLWIFGLRRSESTGRAFALFASSAAIAIAGIFDLYTTHRLTALWTLAVAVSGGALFDLALGFPQEFRVVAARPYLRRIGYLIALVLTALAARNLYNFDNPSAYITDWQRIYSFTGGMIVFLAVVLFIRRYTTKSPVVQQQIRMLIWGFLVSFGPLAAFMLATAIHPMNFIPYLFLPTILFPFATGYTILRYRLLKVDYLVSRGILIILLTFLVALGYGLLIAGLSLIFGNMIPATNPLAIGALAGILALALNPVRARLQTIIDAIAFRGSQAYQEQLQTFSHKLTNALDLPSILRILRQEVLAGLLPNRLHIYIYDAVSDQYAATPSEDNGRPTSDIRFTGNNPLVTILKREHLPLYIDPSNPPAALKSEQSRLMLLGAYLFVPLRSGNELMGWLALGLRRSGEPYSSHELSFLESLSDQAALAIERAQVVVNMQRRVQEMNALTRVSQGVSITLSFDDVLELIFAQTTQIIPATDFHITLHNKAGEYFYYAFCLEDGKRLPQRENTPLPVNQGLGQWVVRNSRSILTQDYARECQTLNVIPALQDMYAWLGVPLNAGAEAIGALSVGSRDPSTTYTNNQLDLLQAIADQTAGAIVKARLLQETERRAHQLSTLNELTRQLTSTLEHEPLLQNILENAVNILDCEAGSLFLVDEQSNDLVFKVTVGPVAGNLLGKRLPAGSGIVGKAVQTRAPVVENNVKQSSGWFGNTDQQTGFVTKAILAVPLQVKENVIGVVEVINKRDGLPFVEDDQTLLTAFAGQAAVAIENARLYTLTDQELNARVEELSIMQRIDRELNASLEMDRAMRITLEWAMRQSGADAGLISTLQEDGVRIMAQQGYGDQLNLYEDTPLPLELPSMVAAVESGQPQNVTLDPKIQGGLLPGTRTQVVIPIRREAQVIGLILLECVTETQVDLGFLGRLSDHAAIAISNAQLYAEVQAANLAKSDFVSFVAHELKNPMTSIKGYAELLAAGAVGEINENQANFLSTIHSNVERMKTLVSDLNDNSKIEAGRLRMDFKPVSVPEVVNDAVRSTRRQIEDKQQAITIQMPDTLPDIWADRTRLDQILVNLLSNANKYTPEEGEIFIGAKESDNQWDPEGAAKVVHIWVKDNGIGISLEDQQKIFQKFFRSEDQKAREAPGTGLGLNITKSLVEMQGGRIWFESEYGQGTTFHFTIPVAEK